MAATTVNQPTARRDARRRGHGLFGLRPALAAAFALAALVPAIAFGLWYENAAYRLQVDAVADKHLLVARQVTGALDRYARDVEAVFALYARAAASGSDIEGLGILARQLGFRHFCLIDRSGRVVASIGGIADTPDFVPGEKLGDIVRLAASRPGRIGHVAQDANGTPVLHLAQPAAGGLIALGTLGTGYFRELQQSVSFGQKGHAAIVDPQGRLLAHPRDEWWQSARNIAGVAPVRRMMQGETGVMTFFSPAAEADMITGYTVVPSTGWGVMVPQPLDELAAAAQRGRRAAFALLAGFVALAGLCGWLVAGRIERRPDAAAPTA